MRNRSMLLTTAALVVFWTTLHTPASAHGLQIDTDQDGVVTVTEFQTAFPEYAANPDLNEDGVIDREEMHAARTEMGDAGGARQRKGGSDTAKASRSGDCTGDGSGSGGKGGSGGSGGSSGGKGDSGGNGNGHGGGGQGGHGGGNGHGGRGGRS